MNGFIIGTKNPAGIYIETLTFENIDDGMIMSRYVNNVFKSSEKII